MEKLKRIAQGINELQEIVSSDPDGSVDEEFLEGLDDDLNKLKNRVIAYTERFDVSPDSGAFEDDSIEDYPAVAELVNEMEDDIFYEEDPIDWETSFDLDEE